MRLSGAALRLPVGLAAAVAATVLAAPAQPGSAKTCRPNAINETPNDSYVPGSPVRSVVGKGHVIRGTVRSVGTCRAIARARLEFFHAGPDGNYSDGVTSWAHRATVFTRADGSYRFKSRYPSNSAGVRPHIHVRVSAPGFEEMNATYFARPGKRNVSLFLLLSPRK